MMANNALTYKGYAGVLEVDTEAGIIFGSVLDIKDTITFKCVTVQEASQAFHESVDDYLEFCKELGQEPDKPFSGRFAFRTTPEVHRKIYIAAQLSRKSLRACL